MTLPNDIKDREFKKFKEVSNEVVVRTELNGTVPLPTGASTSAKQLPDGHNVNVSNISSTPLITGFATSDNQTDGSQKTQVIDSTGNSISSHLETDGSYHLGSSITQHVVEDPNNSSTDNLNAGNSYTFTGTGTSTLGVVGLQFNLKTDQNATIYIEQSDDNTNWDLSDEFDYYYSKGGFGGTIQATASYWRIRVVLTGTTATTYFRLLGILCPIATPLPNSLNRRGRLKTSGGIIDEETNTTVKVDTLGNLRTSKFFRLVGTIFDGTTKDTIFWTESVTGSGSVAQAGQITLATGTTADSTVKYYSVRKARKIAGASNQFRAVARLTTDLDDDNIRRIGCYNDNDGFFFQVNGSVFSIGSRKGGVDTLVSSGSFNGNYGASVTMSTSLFRLIIEYDFFSVRFFLNDILLHNLVASTAPLTNYQTLPITMENINSGGNTTNNAFEVRFATIVRVGEFLTHPTSYYFPTGQTAGVTLKSESGNLQGFVILSNANNAVISLADSTSAATPLIFSTGSLTARTDPVFIDLKGIPFSDGLRLVVATANASCLVIYE